MSEDYRISDEELKKGQQKMLDMLLYFQEFCDKHGLMFYLHGGAAIGAVREHGFVPWDDDIDVLMPRPDYEKFEKLWEKYGDKERYVFCKTNENVNYHHPCASLRDPNTTFISSYNQNLDICHGIALELGPMDACPDSAIKHFFQLFYAFVFVLFNTQRLPNNKGKFFRAASYIMYKLVPSKKVRNKIWRFAERKISQYSWENATHVSELRGSIKFMFKKYPKEWFDSVVYFDFCGHKVPLMKGYDQYLGGIFGNYKKRPPKSAQVAKHDLAFSDMDKPYTYYKGIKYFPGTKDVGGAM